MTTLLQLQAELAGEQRAIRHLIGERKAANSAIARDEAKAKLIESQIHAITTRGHPAVNPAVGPLPHGARFPDVSSFQPNVDWPVIRDASSVRVGELAFTKISEGATWTDPFGAHRFRLMAAAGFPHRGGYHFFHPSVSPIVQATHFLEAAHADGVVVRPSDILACDLEVSDGERAQVVAAGAKAFAAELRKHVDCKLWLYGGGPFLHEFAVSLEGYDAHWLAAYVGDPTPFMVYGRARTIAWQYTDGRFGPVPHVCPGIGAGDLSILL